MKWQIQLSIIFTILYPVSNHAFVGYDPSKVSPNGQLFADRVIQVYCRQSNGAYSKEYCIDSPRNKQIIDELWAKGRPFPFYGLVELENPYSWRPNRKIEDYIGWAKTIPFQDWLELTRHSDPYVRVSAFQALVYAFPEVDIVPFLIEHLDDNTEVKRGAYDESGREKVGDVFFSIAAKLNPLSVLNVEKFNASQRAILFNALLTTPNELKATTAFLLWSEPKPEFYERIRATVTWNKAALVPLSRYQKEQDIKLIKGLLSELEYTLTTKDRNQLENLYYLFRGLRYFPHSEFFPLLQDRLNKSFSEERLTGRFDYAKRKV